MDIFEEAKKVSLTEFLEGFLGETPINAGNNHRFKVCPHCGPDQTHLLIVFDDERYFCHRCNATGSVIDVAMIAQGLHTPLEAAKFLTGDIDMSTNKQRYPAQTQKKEDSASVESVAMEKVIKGLLKISSKTFAPVFKYLTEVRGFSEKTVIEAISRKFILVLDGHPRLLASRILGLLGEDCLREAGFIGDKGVKIIPYRPIVIPLAHRRSAEFRLARPPREGELKSITKGLKDHDVWFWKGDPEKADILVCEGAMDMLAAYDMGFKGHMFGLPGTTSFGDGTKLVTAIKAVSKDNTLVHLALDTDEAGNAATQKLSGILKTAGIKHSIMAMEPNTKDLNEVLLARKARRAAQPSPTPPAPAPVEPVIAAPAQDVPAAEAPAKVKKPRKPSTTPRKPRAKKAQKPTTIWGRVKLSIRILMGSDL